MRTRRVAVVISHPIQHFCPLYQRLARDGRVEVKVFFGSTAGVRPYYDPAFRETINWQEDLVIGFDHEFLADAESKDPGQSISNPNLQTRLEAFQIGRAHV